MKIQIDPRVRVVDLVAALASRGLCLKANAESGDLFLTYAPDRCPHGVECDGEMAYTVCEQCAQDLAAEQAEAGVGR